MMRYKSAGFLLILLLLTATFLQGKSVPKAMLLSALLPGTGEMYAGNISRGIAFSTADIVLFYSAHRFNNEVHWLNDSAKQFANTRAGIPANRDSGYYELVQKWYSSDIYNDEVELYFRNLGLVRYNNPDYYLEEIEYYSISDENAWQWNTQADWKQYKIIRRDKQTQLMNRKLAVGALIANRVISVLDATVLVRKHNKKYQPHFSIAPDFINNGAVINCSVEF